MDIQVDDHTQFAHLNNRTYEWLEEEEDKITRQLCSVRSLLNSHITACRLPEELLVEIFLCLASFCGVEIDWIYVTHVCRHWRAVALGSQILWSCIIPRKRTFMSTSLQRSGEAPLRLRWDDIHHSPVQFWDILSRHIDRFVSVDLSLPCREMWRLMQLLFRSQWSNLEFLSLTTQTWHPTLSSSLDIEPPPKLRYLRLHGVSPQTFGASHVINLSMYHRLHTLHLMHHDNSLERPTMTQFLELLRSCLSLENLVLVDWGPRLGVDVTTYPNPVGKVDLHHLRRLGLAFKGSQDLAYLLAHLILPETVHTSLHQLAGPSSMHPGLICCLPYNRSGLKFMGTISGVSLRFRKRNIVIQAFHDGHNDVNDPCLKIMARGRKVNYVDEIHIHHTFRQLPFIFSPASSQLKTLSVRLRLARVSAKDWYEVLSALRSLETLTVNNDSTYFQYDNYEGSLLVPKVLAAPPSTSDPCLLPRLQLLHLLNFKINRELKDCIWQCVNSRRLCLTAANPSSFRLMINDEFWEVS